MKLPSATKEDNDEFCNDITTRAAAAEEKRKEKREDNLRTIQVVERASEQRSQEAPRRQVRRKISEENPFFSFHPHTPSQGTQREGS